MASLAIASQVELGILFLLLNLEREDVVVGEIAFSGFKGDIASSGPH